MIELDVLSKADVARDGQPRVWRSPADKARTPDAQALAQREFHPEALADDAQPGPSRRSFMKIMGASMALAGLAGCRRPAEEILPYARKPEAVIPGVPNYYATSMPLGGPVQGLLVRTHEGRPTKVEGNPAHPTNRGATDVFAQASVLNLYDPDRSRVVRQAGAASSSWDQFVAFARRLRTQGVQGDMAVLAAPSESPTRARLRAQLEAAYPGLRWITYRALGDDTQALGLQEAFGRPLRPAYDFEDAAVIVSFDSDETSAESLNRVANQRGLAASRRLDRRTDEISRIYLAESQMSVMGGMADHRLRLRAADVPHFAAAVAQRLGVGGGTAASGAYADLEMVDALVGDVQEASGRVAFTAGATQPPAVHALVAALNARYGQEVVRYYDTGAATVEPQDRAIGELVNDMAAGRVGALLCLDANPVYSAPIAAGFAQAMQGVPVVIHAGAHVDETGQLATWHLPLAHYLEQWGDGRAYDGTLSPIQPTIAPLYADAHSDLEILNVLATGQDVAGYDLVRETWRGVLPGPFEDAWRAVLHEGVLPGTGYAAVPPGGAAAPDLSGLPVVPADTIEMVVRLSGKTYDGAFASNAWMQELPEMVTKITWDNVAVMSPATADALGVNSDLRKGKQYVSVVRLAVGPDAVELPAWVQPGHPDNSVTVVAGYGRDLLSARVPPEKSFFQRFKFGYYDNDLYDEGPLANGVGVNVAPMRPLGGRVALLDGVTIAGEDYMIATTQDHGGLNVDNAVGAVEDRGIVRQTTLAAYQQGDDAAYDPIPLVEDTPWQAYPPIWGEERTAAEDPRIGEAMYSEQQWAMSIDLNTCTGCNACVIACQSENNIQVVGKEQVSKGREMHWMRIDRYYLGEDVDAPEMVTMPMLCQHCEYAPCEQVCPVNATIHSPDGLNAMIYNRCVGTRYCANNCPYKVRRYNFYNWTQMLPIEVQMAQNPNVTVRFRGVMEKCTFCVHRLRQSQGLAHIEDRPVDTELVQTACQQACPSQAITFGDLNNPESAVNAARRSDRNYGVLAYLNVKPRVTYQARVTNPNPALAGPVEVRGGGHGDDHGDGAVHGEAHS